MVKFLLSLLLLSIATITNADINRINGINWTTSVNRMCSVGIASMNYVGVQASVLTVTETAISANMFEATTGWNVNNCDQLATNTEHKDGSNGLTYRKAQTSYTDTGMWKNHGLNFSTWYNDDGSMKTGAKVYIWLYIKDATALAKISTTVGVRTSLWQTEGSFTSTHLPSNGAAGGTALAAGWNKIPFGTMTKTNSPTAAGAYELDLFIDTTTAATTFAAGDFIWDDIHTEPN